MSLATGTATTVAAVEDITIEQGADVDVPWVLKNPDGTVYQLTGASALMRIRAFTDSTVVLLELSTANSKIQLDTVNGILTMKFAAADFAAGAWWSGVYDLKITTSANKKVRILKGHFYVDPE